jgi:hypothetical protein
MIIPKGKPIHKELSSSFVDLAKLVEELRTNGFSGTIDLVGLKHEGEILMEHGSREKKTSWASSISTPSSSWPNAKTC